MKDLTNSFSAKHEKLIKEENEMKEELDNKVTKAKEQLENFLSISNNNIKISEKIEKGVKKLEKEEKNLIKNLSYISKINKTKKEMNSLFQELIYGLKFSFIEEKNNIKFEEFFFNGLPVPKDIQFSDVSNVNLKISWKIDELNIINIDNKQIKYVIEMRKENENFKKIYEGNDNNYFVDNLEINTEYEFRIKSVYNNELQSYWSNILKIKTEDYAIDSMILKESKRIKEFCEKIIEWVGNDKFELIYRGSRDGVLSKNFHEKCDNKGKTLVLYKNDKDNIFGGYSTISWTSNSDSFLNAPGSFIFTLTNIYNTVPTQFLGVSNQKHVRHNPNYSPCFGGGTDIGINTNYSNSGGWSWFPDTYQDVLGKGKSIFTGNTNINESGIKIKDIEVFRVNQ